MMVKKLKILGHEYKVEHISGLGGDCGVMSTAALTIGIDKGLQVSRRREVLLHEILEALNYHLELNLEHPVINQLSEGLYQVLADNKLLKEI